LSSYERTGAPRATLVARLTPPGEGGISVIELLGPDAAAILDRLFVSPRRFRASTLPEGRLAYGRLWRDGALLDEVLIECVRRGPEQLFAVNAHGGAVALQRVLAGITAEGAEQAAWRQLLDRRKELGLLDAVQCEAAEALPNALTLRAAHLLIDQYRGALAAAAREARADLEREDRDAARARIETLLATAPFGIALTSPMRLVIAGRPNAGKSTLGNLLLRHDRLIVHETPGTTRDTVEDYFAVEGVPFLLVDTAGLRDASEEIESEGVRRSRKAIEQADMVLLVLDSSQPLNEEETAFAVRARDKRAVFVLNKSDLPPALNEQELRRLSGSEPVRLRALTGDGLDELESRILRTACPILPAPGAPLCFTARQRTVLESALNNLAEGRPKEAGESLAAL
jgi:tRNA modification GTPase